MAVPSRRYVSHNVFTAVGYKYSGPMAAAGEFGPCSIFHVARLSASKSVFCAFAGKNKWMTTSAYQLSTVAQSQPTSVENLSVVLVSTQLLPFL